GRVPRRRRNRARATQARERQAGTAGGAPKPPGARPGPPRRRPPPPRAPDRPPPPPWRARRPPRGGGPPPGREADPRPHVPPAAHELRDPQRAQHEAVGPEPLDKESSERVDPEVGQEQGTRRPLKPPPEGEVEEEEADGIPERLVEEGRMEELLVHEGRRPAGLRDVELPGQVGRPAERLFVEEVAPSPDRLREDERRRNDVQVGQKRQTLGPDVGAAREQPRDEPPVDRQAAFPHGEAPPPRLGLIVVEVEEDVVEAGADQAADESDLRRLEQ